MIKIGWGDYEESLMIYRAEIPWSIDEQFSALHRCYTLIREKDYIVDALIDLRHVSVMSSYDTLFYRSLALSRPENLGALVHITNLSFSKQLRNLWNTIGAYRSLDLYIVDNVDKAYSMVEVARQKSRVVL